MNRARTSNILLIVGIVALFAGVLLTIFIPVSMALLLAAVAIRPGMASRRSPKMILLAAVLFAGIAVFGFCVLIATWGTMEYGLIGYVTLFGPFISSVIAFTLLFTYFIVRTLGHDGDLPKRIAR